MPEFYLYDKVSDVMEKFPKLGIFLSVSPLIVSLLDTIFYKVDTLKTKILKNRSTPFFILSTREYKNSSKHNVEKTANLYKDMYTEDTKVTTFPKNTEESLKRVEGYKDLVSNFYDLVTDFYTYGWGHSFHFAPRWKNETLMDSIKRYEYSLANKIGLKPGSLCLDVGCGVGGPMRNMAKFSGAQIEGITINEYQTQLGNRFSREMQIDHLCHSNCCDFQNIMFSDEYFDAAFSIEATCHSPDRTKTFQEIYRVLKPGSYYGCFEWIVTENYNSENSEHVALKKAIEEGNGLPCLTGTKPILDAMKEAGFEIIEGNDLNKNLHASNQTPWYDPLDGEFTIDKIHTSFWGRKLTSLSLSILESFSMVSPGTTKVSNFLNQAADDLVKAGKKEIFTPSYFVLVRKPLKIE